MPIFMYNPKTHETFIPNVSLTVPFVKSFDDAKTIANNPLAWQCIVKSKSGKTITNFADRTSAEDYAMQKCGKTATYIVYENAKPVSAFVNKKRLPTWQTVYFRNEYKETGQNNFVKRVCKNLQGFTPCANNKTKTAEAIEVPWSTAVEKTDDKVRVVVKTLHVYATRRGKPVTNIKTSSLTIHKNGRMFFYKDGTVKAAGLKHSNFSVNDKVKSELIKVLSEFKPGFKMLNINGYEYNIFNIGRIYSRPNARYATDEYSGTVKYRDSAVRAQYEITKNIPHEAMDESILIPYLADKMNVPCSKQFKSLYLQDIGNIILVKNLLEAGFKDVNNIIKASSLAWILQFERRNPNFVQFVSYLLRMKGEIWLTKATVKEGAKPLMDIFDMIVRNRPDRNDIDYVISRSTNIAQIHDTIVRITASRNIKGLMNETIPYSDKEKTLERTYGDITFSLPVDTKTLAYIGRDMGICVGGYGDAAVRKRCTIVRAMDKNKYIACIELRGKEMVQMKSYYNNPVKAEYKSVIDKWLKDTGVGACKYDYDRIGEEWRSRCRYDQVNPNNFREPIPMDGKVQIVQVGPGENEDWHKNWANTLTEYVDEETELRR